MFILETNGAKAAKKMVVIMAIAFVLIVSFGALLTMYIYVKPSRPIPRGFRIFGFPRPRDQASHTLQDRIRSFEA